MIMIMFNYRSMEGRLAALGFTSWLFDVENLVWVEVVVSVVCHIQRAVEITDQLPYQITHFLQVYRMRVLRTTDTPRMVEFIFTRIFTITKLSGAITTEQWLTNFNIVYKKKCHVYGYYFYYTSRIVDPTEWSHYRVSHNKSPGRLFCETRYSSLIFVPPKSI